MTTAIGASRFRIEADNPVRSAKAYRKIGFYGCADRVVRIEYEKPRHRFPRVMFLEECPACGHGHRVHLMWRVPAEMDEGRVPELVLPGTDVKEDSNDTSGGLSRPEGAQSGRGLHMNRGKRRNG